MRLFCDSDGFSDAAEEYGSRIREPDSTSNLMFLIRQYMSSKPESRDSSSGIHITGLILQFRMGRITPGRTGYLRRVLIFRLQMDELANLGAKKLNLDKLPPIAQWDLIYQKVRGDHHPEASKIMDIILESGIFKRPEGKYGMPGPGYPKPIMYLAYAILESGYDAEDAKGLIAQIKDLRYLDPEDLDGVGGIE